MKARHLSVVEVTFVVGGISDEESALFEAVNAFEFLDEFTGDFGISGVVGQCGRDQRDAFFGHDDMSAVPPEENEVVLSAVDFLVGVVREGS